MGVGGGTSEALAWANFGAGFVGLLEADSNGLVKSGGAALLEPAVGAGLLGAACEWFGREFKRDGAEGVKGAGTDTFDTTSSGIGGISPTPVPGLEGANNTSESADDDGSLGVLTWRLAVAPAVGLEGLPISTEEAEESVSRDLTDETVDEAVDEVDGDSVGGELLSELLSDFAMCLATGVTAEGISRIGCGAIDAFETLRTTGTDGAVNDWMFVDDTSDIGAEIWFRSKDFGKARWLTAREGCWNADESFFLPVNARESIVEGGGQECERRDQGLVGRIGVKG